MTSQLDKLGAITSPGGLYFIRSVENIHDFLSWFVPFIAYTRELFSFLYQSQIVERETQWNAELLPYWLKISWYGNKNYSCCFFRGLIDDGHETFYVMPEIGHEASLTEIQIVTSVEFRWTAQEFSSLHLPIHNIVKILIVCIVFG